MCIAALIRGVLAPRSCTRIKSFVSVFPFLGIVENFRQVRVSEYRSCVAWAHVEF
jgi:hypothetical protein